jgi:type I restriction enzyme S subunit
VKARDTGEKGLESLIADVVSGKLDVRQAEAHLPEEAAEPNELDERNLLAEAGGDNDGDPDPVPEEVEE